MKNKTLNWVRSSTLPTFWLTGLSSLNSSPKHLAPGQSNCCLVTSCKERSRVCKGMSWLCTHKTHSKLTIVCLSMLLTVLTHLSAHPVESVGSWSVLHSDNQQSNHRDDTQVGMSALSMSANLLAALAALVEWLTSHILQGILVVKDASHYCIAGKFGGHYIWGFRPKMSYLLIWWVLNLVTRDLNP